MWFYSFLDHQLHITIGSHVRNKHDLIYMDGPMVVAQSIGVVRDMNARCYIIDFPKQRLRANVGKEEVEKLPDGVL